MLSRENQLRIPERVSELKQSLQDIKLIIERGEIISDLNETRNLTLSATKVGRFLLLAHWEP
jgi:hypothetical protein